MCTTACRAIEGLGLGRCESRHPLLWDRRNFPSKSHVDLGIQVREERLILLFFSNTAPMMRQRKGESSHLYLTAWQAVLAGDIAPSHSPATHVLFILLKH